MGSCIASDKTAVKKWKNKLAPSRSKMKILQKELPCFLAKQLHFTS